MIRADTFPNLSFAANLVSAPKGGRFVAWVQRLVSRGGSGPSGIGPESEEMARRNAMHNAESIPPGFDLDEATFMKINAAFDEHPKLRTAFYYAKGGMQAVLSSYHLEGSEAETYTEPAIVTTAIDELKKVVNDDEHIFEKLLGQQIFGKLIQSIEAMANFEAKNRQFQAAEKAVFSQNPLPSFKTLIANLASAAANKKLTLRMLAA